jgi:type IV secretion system protein TrbL
MSRSNTNGERHFGNLVILSLLTLCFLLFCAIDSSEAFDFDGDGVYTSVEYIDSLITVFNEKLSEHSDTIYGYAKTLFYLLFFIQIIWSFIQVILQENSSFGAFVITAIRQTFIGMLFWWILFDRSVLRTIVASFSNMASSGLNFGELLSKQWALVTDIWGMTSISDGSIFVGALTCIILCYVVSMAVGLLAVTYLENIVAGTLGFVLMGFGGAEWTRSFTLSYIRALVAIGFKLFLVTIILSVGIQTFDTLVGATKKVAETVTTPYGKDGDMRTKTEIKTVIVNARTTSESGSVSELCFSTIASAFLFHSLIQIVPSITSTLLSGATLGAGVGSGILRSFTGGTGAALSTAAGFAIGSGSIVTGGVKGGLQGMRNATQSAAEAYSTNAPSSTNVSVAKGMAGLAGLASGALFGAGKTAAYEVARDLGSPSFRGSRTQRLFESVADKIDPKKDTGRAMTPPPAHPTGNAAENTEQKV